MSGSLTTCGCPPAEGDYRPPIFGQGIAAAAVSSSASPTVTSPASPIAVDGLEVFQGAATPAALPAGDDITLTSLNWDSEPVAVGLDALTAAGPVSWFAANSKVRPYLGYYADASSSVVPTYRNHNAVTAIDVIGTFAGQASGQLQAGDPRRVAAMRGKLIHFGFLNALTGSLSGKPRTSRTLVMRHAVAQVSMAEANTTITAFDIDDTPYLSGSGAVAASFFAANNRQFSLRNRQANSATAFNVTIDGDAGGTASIFTFGVSCLTA